MTPLPDLIGIVEQDNPTGTVRTAVLAGPDGTLHFLVTGESLDEAYCVSAIESDRVIVTHTASGRTSQLILN